MGRKRLRKCLSLSSNDSSDDMEMEIKKDVKRTPMMKRKTRMLSLTPLERKRIPESRPVLKDLVQKEKRNDNLSSPHDTNNLLNDVEVIEIVDENGSQKEMQDNTSLWTEKYMPTSIVDVAVHVNKKREVRKWITDAFTKGNKNRFLFLCGPSGCGKSTLITSLVNEMQIPILQWADTAGIQDTPYIEKNVHSISQQRSSRTYVSALQDFQTFLYQSCIYSSLPLTSKTTKGNGVHAATTNGVHAATANRAHASTKQQVILVEEWPLCHREESVSKFHSLLTTVLTRTKFPIIFIYSDVQHKSKVSLNALSRLFSPTVMESEHSEIIHCNPIAKGKSIAYCIFTSFIFKYSF